MSYIYAADLQDFEIDPDEGSETAYDEDDDCDLEETEEDEESDGE